MCRGSGIFLGFFLFNPSYGGCGIVITHSLVWWCSIVDGSPESKMVYLSGQCIFHFLVVCDCQNLGDGNTCMLPDKHGSSATSCDDWFSVADITSWYFSSRNRKNYCWRNFFWNPPGVFVHWLHRHAGMWSWKVVEKFFSFFLDVDVMFESSSAGEFHPYSTWALANCARAPQRLPTRVRLRMTDDLGKSSASPCLRLAVEIRLGAPYEGWKQVSWVPNRAHAPLLRIGQPNELACLLLAIRLNQSYEPSFHVVVFRAWFIYLAWLPHDILEHEKNVICGLCPWQWCRMMLTRRYKTYFEVRECPYLSPELSYIKRLYPQIGMTF